MHQDDTVLLGLVTCSHKVNDKAGDYRFRSTNTKLILFPNTCISCSSFCWLTNANSSAGPLLTPGESSETEEFEKVATVYTIKSIPFDI